MALTETQIRNLGAIVDVIYDEMNFYCSSLTSVQETLLTAQLTRWDTYGYSYFAIHPKESNKGYASNTESIKNDVRKRIANILGVPELAAGANGQIALMRG